MPSLDLNTVDSDWAWRPFEPDAQHPWTPALAAHLYRRAGFAPSPAELDAALKSRPGDLVAAMFERSEPVDFEAQMDELGRATSATGDTSKLPAWWCYRLLATPDPLREKATLFWHGHFATSAAKVTDPELMLAHFRILRSHALGDFNALAQQMARDPAMLLWLDSATNRKAHPNENFARELMELFCLGEGNYSETDIRELARCFTGWEVRNKAFRFNRFQHDAGTKSFLGHSGECTGEQGVDVVLAQSACPEFLVRKLIRYYLCDEPQPPDDLIAPLAEQLRDDDLHVANVLRRILSSNLFFSAHSVARQVRSPVDLVVGLLRALDATTNNYRLAEGLERLGQRLFFPPNVKGWDGGRAWINSSTLIARANLIRQLLFAEETRFHKGSLSQLFASSDVNDGAEVIEWLQRRLLAVRLPETVATQLADGIDRGDGDREHRLRTAVHLLATQPEFQLG
ncbi:MAG: DUF1800 domain-containing protein [Planctomycetaceae bacterium]